MRKRIETILYLDLNKITNGQADRYTDGRTDKRTDRQTQSNGGTKAQAKPESNSTKN